MMRGSFPTHRRYSITHRAVQRLRELVPLLDERDDEILRDRLDEALTQAEDGGKAVRTLDAMHMEPQVLIPMEDFGETLYAIIKEDTVVTVLPRGHGEEILHRGQSLQQRMATGDVTTIDREREREGGDRWDPRRRWRRDTPTPVIIERARPHDLDSPLPTIRPAPANRPAGGVMAEMYDALARGRRAAAVRVLRDALVHEETDANFLPIWNELAADGVTQHLTIGDLATAFRD